MLYKGKLDQIIMCLYVEVICKIQTIVVDLINYQNTDLLACL